MKWCCECCEWWTKHTQYWQQEGCGECKNPHFVYTGEGAEIRVNELGYWDTESYHAGFFTGSEFGCIHFVPRAKTIDKPEMANETDNTDPDELEIL